MKALRNVFFVLSFLFAPFAAFAAVDINTADAQALADAIDGVGIKRAEAIVAYRQEHGPFQSVDDLVNVKGIGPKILENNRDELTVGGKQ